VKESTFTTTQIEAFKGIANEGVDASLAKVIQEEIIQIIESLAAI
jgi:hypothetical protein